MSKKKVLLSSFLIITCLIVSAASGLIGANLVIDNGRISFINTSHNIYIGEEAGDADATDVSLPLIEAHNVGVGRQALMNVKSNADLLHGTRNACLGGHCMHDAFDADRNTCIGTACLYGNISGTHNTTAGYHAGAKHKGNFATLIGAFTEEMNESAFMSLSAGYAVARYNQGTKNVFLGATSARDSLNVNNSVFIGMATGNEQQSGDNNVVIGYNQNLENINGSNQLNLAGVLRSSNVYTGHLRMRQGAGLELVNVLGDVYRLTVDAAGNLDIILQP